MCQRIDNGESRAKIADDLRHAIYLRDRHTCLYCGRILNPALNGMFRCSLEHLQCWTNNGADSSDNLFVCCGSCNSSRNKQELRSWCRETGVDYAEVRREVRRRRRRKVNLVKGAREYARVQAERKALREMRKAAQAS
jgi:hypothetical protein